MNTENRLYLKLAGVFAVLVTACVFVPSATLAFDIQQICAESSSGAEVHHAIRLAENQLAHLKQQQLLVRQQSSEKQASPLSDPRFHELEQATAALREQLRACRTQQESVSSTTIDTSKMAASTADTYTVSGTVSLPGDEVTPEGGLSVTVVLATFDFSTYVSTDVTIDSGAQSTGYSILIPADASDNLLVFYLVSYFDENYYWRGFYAPGGTTWFVLQATELVPSQDYEDIDLTLIHGKTITGTVSLPGDDVAPEDGMYIGIVAYGDVGGSFFISDGDSFSIEEDQRSAAYSLKVPADITVYVGYELWELEFARVYLQNGYYTPAGTTSWRRNQARLLFTDQDYTDIHLRLLTGKTITGTISLPGNDTAPDDGIGAHIFALNFDNDDLLFYVYTETSIDHGMGSVDYSLAVPDDDTENFVVRYNCWGCEDYLREGYYASGGTTPSRDLATLLTAGQDHNGIDLTLLPDNPPFSWGLFLPTIFNAGSSKSP
jgi:hypothetical protein